MLVLMRDLAGVVQRTSEVNSVDIPTVQREDFLDRTVSGSPVFITELPDQGIDPQVQRVLDLPIEGGEVVLFEFSQVRLEFGELRDRQQVVATLSETPTGFDEGLACEQQAASF
jgi:hypothetical protein